MAKLESQTVSDICEFLEENGFPQSVLDSVKDEELDGDAIALGLASDPGPVWLKDIIPKMGMRLKVHNALRSLWLQSQPPSTPVDSYSPSSVYTKCNSHDSGTEIVDTDHEEMQTPSRSPLGFDLDEDTDSVTRSSKSSNLTPLSAVVHHSSKLNVATQKLKNSFSAFTTRKYSNDQSKPMEDLILTQSTSASSSTFNKKVAKSSAIILDSFEVPTFRAATEKNLRLKKRNEGDRKYIVQVLATNLMTKLGEQKPSLKDCGKVAKALVSKHEFLKDDEGDGEHSWKWFIYYRCNNVNRPAKDDGTPRPKKAKLEDSTTHLYPLQEGEDDDSYQRNLKLLKDEMQKTSRRADVIKSLLSRTFPNRWNDFVNNSRPPTLKEYIKEFLVLKKPNYAAVEFSLLQKRMTFVRKYFHCGLKLW